MPTFSQRRTPNIAQRMADLANAPQIAAVDPNRRFEMPREQGPAVSSSLETEMQRLIGAQPDAALVQGPELYPKAQVKPDLFSAAVAAVKALGKRKPDEWGKTGQGRFTADVNRSLHLQERDERA